MNIIEGDLIKLAGDGRFDVIVHGCNCFCTMGAGLARGDWDVIAKIIDEELSGEDHTLVKYKP